MSSNLTTRSRSRIRLSHGAVVAGVAIAWAALMALGAASDQAPLSGKTPEQAQGASESQLAATSSGLAGPSRHEQQSVVPETKSAAAPVALDDPLVRAKQLIAACRDRYEAVKDYTCTFHKRERIEGRTVAPAMLAMKCRCRPTSIYVKFLKPTPGREGIWVDGRNDGKVIVHDVGVLKFLAGTMYLDPNSSEAMEDCRHPITEAGIGNLIDNIAYHWDRELTPDSGARVKITADARFGDHPCTLIEATHPNHKNGFMFHAVKVFIDRDHGLPIRYEAYDWPRRPGAAPDLVEEYTYANLRLNTGLGERDFDPSNTQYSFGRF